MCSMEYRVSLPYSCWYWYAGGIHSSKRRRVPQEAPSQLNLSTDKNWLGERTFLNLPFLCAPVLLFSLFLPNSFRLGWLCSYTFLKTLVGVRWLTLCCLLFFFVTFSFVFQLSFSFIPSGRSGTLPPGCGPCWLKTSEFKHISRQSII